MILYITQSYTKKYFYDLAESNYAFKLESEKEFLDSYVSEKEKLIENFIKQTQWKLERESSEGFTEISFLEDFTLIEDLKFFQKNNNQIFEQVFLILPNLNMYTYSDLFNLNLPVKATQNQFDRVVHNEKIGMSEARISRYSGDPISSMVHVLKRNNEVIGIVGATINLGNLSIDFSDKTKNVEGDFFVVKDNKYIIHHDSSMILGDVKYDSSILNGEKGIIKKIEQDKILFYTKSPQIKDAYVVSLVSSRDLYGEIDKYMTILLALLLGSLALVMILGYNVARKLTTPVIKLKEAMDNATGGDFFARAENQSDDEIGKAIDSFNILMERIRNLTFFDKLTNLPNYEQFKYWFSQEVKNTKISKKSFSFVLISINGFKAVNETYGIDAGDQVMIQIAGRLRNIQKRFPSLSYISRFSGDEFLLFYKDIENKEELEEDINNVLKNLNFPFLYHGNNMYLRFVIGASFCQECSANLDFQMSAASSARSMAKKAKKEYYIVGPEDNLLHSLVEKKNLENDLYSALENGDFEVFYQPIYNLEKDNFNCLEALIRYHHPERGMISPIEFIPLAEEIGIIDKIGEFVLEQSFKDLIKLENKGFKEIDIHVNISPEHFNKEDFVEIVVKSADKYRFPLKKLWLEITEEVAIFNLTEQEKKFVNLKEKGIHISIDDFGTGYSSFLYLNQLSIDQIKIDKSFIINMRNNKKDYEIIKTITTLAQSLHLDLVTEGVEDKENFQLLSELGVKKMQGFYFARPMNISNLENFLSEHKK